MVATRQVADFHDPGYKPQPTRAQYVGRLGAWVSNSRLTGSAGFLPDSTAVKRQIALCLDHL